MREPQFEPGTILADKYRLESRLGEGGMGTVYRATHLLLKAPVAIKVIDREVSTGDVALSRFMREAQAAASLRSPHVVQVLDYGTEQGRPFMVMELLEGESLADRIDRLGTLTPSETYRVLSHVARAVAKAHEAGIIHRDLKPDNVFLVHNEDDELAKVLDFGVAKVDATVLGGEGHTRTGSLLGTPYYMSPEQAQGNKEVDHRSDLWALGVIAFECLTGKRPFYSDGLGDVVLQICIRDIPKPSERGEVPPGFDAWFERATQRDVLERFQSARELIDALGPALGVAPANSLEGPWSTAAPLPRSALGPRAEEATTEKDPDSSPASARTPSGSETTTASARGSIADDEDPAESPLPTHLHRKEGQGGARWEESVDPPSTRDLAPAADSPGTARDDAPKDSQWEIVPHDDLSLAEVRGVQPRPRNLALELALAEDKRRPGSVLLLGLLFLMLGAAAVLFVRGFVGPEATSPADLLRYFQAGSRKATPRPRLPQKDVLLPGEASPGPNAENPSAVASGTSPEPSPQAAARPQPAESPVNDDIDAQGTEGMRPGTQEPISGAEGEEPVEPEKTREAAAPKETETTPKGEEQTKQKQKATPKGGQPAETPTGEAEPRPEKRGETPPSGPQPKPPSELTDPPPPSPAP